jgi:RNA-binding protein NOB1
VDAHFKDVEVACLTTDFAMQNILIQMGLHVASVDGMLIKRVKTFVFRCYACHRTAHEKDIHFCPFCGNSTLQKISASVDENGTCLYLSNSRLNLRGKKFSIPPFKGGRSANNVIIKSDQKEYLRARALAKKQADKVHVWGDHAQSSFPYSTAPSKAALSFTKRNPNEVRRTGNRKRKNRKI